MFTNSINPYSQCPAMVAVTAAVAAGAPIRAAGRARGGPSRRSRPRGSGVDGRPAPPRVCPSSSPIGGAVTGSRAAGRGPRPWPGAASGPAPSGPPDRSETVRVEAVETLSAGADNNMIEDGGDDRMLPGQRQRVPTLAQAGGVTDVPVQGGHATQPAEPLLRLADASLNRGACRMPFRQADLPAPVHAGKFVQLRLRLLDLGLPTLSVRTGRRAPQRGCKLRPRARAARASSRLVATSGAL